MCVCVVCLCACAREASRRICVYTKCESEHREVLLCECVVVNGVHNHRCTDVRSGERTQETHTKCGGWVVSRSTHCVDTSSIRCQSRRQSHTQHVYHTRSAYSSTNTRTERTFRHNFLINLVRQTQLAHPIHPFALVFSS